MALGVEEVGETVVAGVTEGLKAGYRVLNR